MSNSGAGTPQASIQTDANEHGAQSTRSKVIEVLADIMNGCLSELGYSPGLRDQLFALEAQNQKLYEDNTKLARSLKTAETHIRVSQIPRDKTVDQLILTNHALSSNLASMERRAAKAEAQAKKFETIAAGAGAASELFSILMERRRMGLQHQPLGVFVNDDGQIVISGDVVNMITHPQHAQYPYQVTQHATSASGQPYYPVTPVVPSQYRPPQLPQNSVSGTRKPSSHPSGAVATTSRRSSHSSSHGVPSAMPGRQFHSATVPSGAALPRLSIPTAENAQSYQRMGIQSAHPPSATSPASAGPQRRSSQSHAGPSQPQASASGPHSAPPQYPAYYVPYGMMIPQQQIPQHQVAPLDPRAFGHPPVPPFSTNHASPQIQAPLPSVPVPTPASILASQVSHSPAPMSTPITPVSPIVGRGQAGHDHAAESTHAQAHRRPSSGVSTPAQTPDISQHVRATGSAAPPPIQTQLGHSSFAAPHPPTPVTPAVLQASANSSSLANALGMPTLPQTSQSPPSPGAGTSVPPPVKAEPASVPLPVKRPSIDLLDQDMLRKKQKVEEMPGLLQSRPGSSQPVQQVDQHPNSESHSAVVDVKPVAGVPQPVPQSTPHDTHSTVMNSASTQLGVKVDVPEVEMKTAGEEPEDDEDDAMEVDENGLRTAESCVGEIMEEADDNEDYAMCSLCKAHYESGRMNAPPQPIVNDMPVLIQHCETMHSLVWDQLRNTV
ncbi:hypothetical protein HGRIS_009345 [Hohenbuehelia grisea]|uniref:Uncharacterized protein n=1 Tax=Hohenbuehelia grisea TaxID=104357 RepID=A0ABR3J0U3_9AGAR